jgi:hypothetical protein
MAISPRSSPCTSRAMPSIPEDALTDQVALPVHSNSEASPFCSPWQGLPIILPPLAGVSALGAALSGIVGASCHVPLGTTLPYVAAYAGGWAGCALLSVVVTGLQSARVYRLTLDKALAWKEAKAVWKQSVCAPYEREGLIVNTVCAPVLGLAALIRTCAARCLPCPSFKKS